MRVHSSCTAMAIAAAALLFDYRVAGDGMRSSGRFQLEAPFGGSERIEVGPGSTASFVVGILGLGVGGAGVAIGLSVVFLNHLSIDGSAGGHPDPTADRVGLFVAGVGAIVALVGLLELVENGRTHVTQHAGARAGAAVLLPSFGKETPGPRHDTAMWAPLVSASF